MVFIFLECRPSVDLLRMDVSYRVYFVGDGFVGSLAVSASQIPPLFCPSRAMIALVNTVYWHQVYDVNTEHMLGVRRRAAHYIREKIPRDETCAAFDIGGLRYYTQLPIIDLGGLIDPNLIQWFSAGKLDQYLVENRVACLVVPGRADSPTDGVMDILKESELSQSNYFQLRQEASFKIDRERWLAGYLLTMNYQLSVIIYKLTK